ncbi:MAG TPA: TonB-dependent receptor [Polyangiaceae bacterium]
MGRVSETSGVTKRLLALLLFLSAPVFAEGAPRIVAGEPAEPVLVEPPEGAVETEAQVVLVLVVDAEGRVESAIVRETLPADLPEAYAQAAVAAVRKTRFLPTHRDGTPVRSRLKFAVTFPPRNSAATSRAVAPRRAELAAAAPAAPPADASAAQPIEVEVRDQWLSPRGVGDVTVNRELLEASPRQFTSELLSAAPGFFVDHENSEGLGNDIFLRGFDLEHGAGIEIGVGNVPVNQPIHIQGQGYVDANFIIPEVVDSIHVLQGPYDPRQGDAAIVGSAFFNLGVPERGYHLSTSYGSFGQARVMGIVAPAGAPKETFAAFAVRRTDGFGERRASRSGTANGQLVLDVGASDRLRFLGAAYAARADLPGVVREDHVDAGLIDFQGSYPHFAEGQVAQSSRVLLSAEWQHEVSAGGQFNLVGWGMWTDFLARQNFAGAFESSRINPEFSGLGDLFERTNLEKAAGLRASVKSASLSLGRIGEAIVEPGTVVRVGDTAQTRSLLVPSTLDTWDRRTDAQLTTLDVGAYLDVDVRLFDRLRIAGGPRVDVLAVSVHDHLAGQSPAGAAPDPALPGERRSALGVAVGPRITAEYAVSSLLAVSSSYGEGFRSLNPPSLEDGATRPFSKVRSLELGARAQDPRGRYKTTIAGYNTWVENELVFVAESGGFETQQRSIRRGIVGSVLAKPVPWLLASSALSVTDAFFDTDVPRISHRVASVPPLIYRADVTARARLASIRRQWLSGRAGLGYTFLSRLHLTDDVRGPTGNILNANVGLRYSVFELELDVYNVLDSRYADSANYYISNWSFEPGQQRASYATHLTAAPPRTLLGTLSVRL